MLSNTFEEKKCVVWRWTVSYHSISAFGQVGRVSNPFGSTLASVIVFGTQLLGLTENGERMLIWDTAETGKHFGSLGCNNSTNLSRLQC
jgi:hypothetical protein